MWPYNYHFTSSISESSIFYSSCARERPCRCRSESDHKRRGTPCATFRLSLEGLDARTASFGACLSSKKRADTPFHSAENGKMAANTSQIIDYTHRGNISQDFIVDTLLELGSLLDLYLPALPRSPAANSARTGPGSNCLSVANS